MSKTISNVNETDFMEVSSITQEITLPSGKVIKIRERNGEDEDYLSRVKDFKDGVAIPKFLSRVIVSEPISWQQIQEWKIRDKYYLLFKERLLCFGSLLEFTYKFEDGTEDTFEEELSNYDWDYGGPIEFPNKGSDNYFSGRALPYKDTSDWFDFTTSSNKKVRMKYLTGVAEATTLGTQIEDLSINSKLTIREFEVEDKKGNWHRVQRFNMFTSKDMAEIRTYVEKYDPDFSMIVTLKNPKTKTSEEVSLLTVGDFFFPKA